MAGFDNDVMYASNVDFSGSTSPAATVTTDGQLLIGSTVAPNIRVGTLVAGANVTITPGAGTITIAATGGGAGTVSGLTPDASTAPGTSPVLPNGGGNIIVTGAQVASGTVGTNVIRTDSLAANTMTIEIQRATSAATSTPADNGVAHFDSSIFTVGAGGFVSLVGGAVPPTQKFDVDAHTAPGTDPVVPTAVGVVTITGAQVAAGVVGTNVIRTDSLAANSLTIEVQRTTTNAISTASDNGVSHFDSAIFTADTNAFISLVGGSVPPLQKFTVDASTPPGTNPVVPTAGGIVTVTGGQVATGTIGANVIQTKSLAANSITIDIQRSTAVAGSDPTKNGVCHFNDAQFTVDANGFVTNISGGGFQSFNIVTFSTPGAFTYIPSVGLKAVVVELVGGGAGSGGVQGAAANYVATGGGGAGAYAKFVLTPAQVGASLAGVIGASGAGGASGANVGIAGGNTTLATAAAWTLQGGQPHPVPATPFGQTAYSGGLGGTVTTGTGQLITSIPGGAGNPGFGFSAITVSGAGGASYYGTGSLGQSSAISSTGSAGAATAYGSGGGGSFSNNSGNIAGSAGKSGLAVFTEYL